MIGLLLAFYPAPWRRRYAEEFRAVLESRRLGPFDVADVLLGALDARLAPRRSGLGAPHGGPRMMLRLGGYGAIAGGLLWFVGLAASSTISNDPLWIGLLILGTIALLVALVGLSAFQAHEHPTLAWAAFAIPGFGALISVVGLTGMILQGELFLLGPLNAWSVWAIGLLAMFVGSILFAIATIRAAVFSRLAAQALAISALLVLVVAVAGIGADTETGTGKLIFGAVVGCFAASWIALGLLAVRSGPIRALAPAAAGN